MILEDFYFEKLLELKNNFSVKIIFGIRGVGKSSLLKSFAEKLRAEGIDESEIIFVDCESNERLRNFSRLYEFIEEQTAELEKFFLLIDEADCVAEAEKAINALFVSAPAEIYVTCSSEPFAEKISALLPDNCDVLKMYPPSFAEYAKYFLSEDAVENYMHFGGLPVTFGANKNSWQKLLRGTTYEIMFELVAKNSIKQAAVFRLLLKIFAQNVGKAISPGNLLEILDCTAATFKNYSGCAASIFKKIPRFDIKTEKFLSGGEKIYCVDNGILCALAEVDEDILMENVVYVELLRRGYEVSCGKFGAMNVTFVAKRDEEKFFVQVLPKNSSIRKATRPLRAMTDTAEKILITLKQEKSFGEIKSITLREFLLNV